MFFLKCIKTKASIIFEIRPLTANTPRNVDLSPRASIKLITRYNSARTRDESEKANPHTRQPALAVGPEGP